MRNVIITVLLILSPLSSARDLKGEFAQYSDQERTFLREQKIPGTRSRCCDENDGTKAQEESKGPYVVSFEACRMNYLGDTAFMECIPVPSMRVPDSAVINEPNRVGRPIVWFYFEQNTVKIKCYLPGAGL